MTKFRKFHPRNNLEKHLERQRKDNVKLKINVLEKVEHENGYEDEI